MKKLDIAKTIQLIVFIILALVCAGLILLNPELYHMIGADSRVRLICGLLWLVLFFLSSWISVFCLPGKRIFVN